MATGAKLTHLELVTANERKACDKDWCRILSVAAMLTWRRDAHPGSSVRQCRRASSRL
jgi:hypothetical protein